MSAALDPFGDTTSGHEGVTIMFPSHDNDDNDDNNNTLVDLTNATSSPVRPVSATLARSHSSASVGTMANGSSHGNGRYQQGGTTVGVRRTESLGTVTHAVSKQTATLQRMLRTFEAKATALEKENKAWQRKEREHKQRSVLLEEHATKNHTLQRLVDKRSRELTKLTSEHTAAEQALQQMRYAYGQAQTRCTALERELKGAVEEVTLNRQYSRQLAQENREKEILYKLSHLKVHTPPSNERKPLPALVALTNELARPQQLPNARCTKMVATLTQQIDELALERDEAVQREKQMINAVISGARM